MNNTLKSLLSLIGRVTYSQKFALITIAFMVPVIAFIPFVSDQLTRIDRYGYKEQSGALYLRNLWNLTDNFESYVISARNYSNNTGSLSEVQKAESVVNANIENLKNIQSEFSETLSLANQFDPIINSWTKVKASVEKKDWVAFEVEQSSLYEAINSLTSYVGDASYLILDPDLDTYYMMDTVLLKLPKNQLLVFQIHQILERATSQEKLTEEDKSKAILLLGQMEANLEAMTRNIDVAIKNDQTGRISSLISNPFDRYKISTQTFINFIAKEINNPTSQFTQNEDQFTLIRTAASELYTAASRSLELGITNRISALSTRLNWAAGIALLSILIALITGQSLMRSISRPLSQLFEATKLLASGDMTARIAVTQTDELGQVASAFNQMADEVERDRASLMGQTNLLNKARILSEKRTQDLLAISEISRISSSELDMNVLLPLIAQTVNKKFNFLFTGIYIVDENKEYAVLEAVSSQSEEISLELGKKYKLGPDSIIGYVAATGRQRLIEKNETDTSDMSAKVRSELAFPLRLAGVVTGVLHLQSQEEDAFTSMGNEAILILADQIAIAIKNAQLLTQTQRALQRAEIASMQLTDLAWSQYIEKATNSGYRYDGVKSEPLRGNEDAADSNDALLVPVQLRGQVIGRLRLRTPESARKITEDERAVIEATAERIAIAIENARLLEDAQSRAAREGLISSISNKLGSTFQMDSIMRDTVEELGQALSGAVVSFQLVNPSAPPMPSQSESATGTSKAE